ncbi:MAG: inositol monophosphatase family protein, partial [Actinomycetota bacterium]
MSLFEDVAAGIARKAGAVLADYLEKEKHIRKKAPLSLLTDADLASQELIVSHLTEEFPDHGILAEEDLSDPGVRPQGRGSGTGPDPKYLWIIDPLDGTTNYAHGYPKFAVSIAVARQGKVIAGAVYDPIAGELFSAARGEGARLNGQPIHVSVTAEIDDTLLATGFPYWTRERPEGLMAKFKAFALRAQGIRRAGAASLDL